MPTCVIPKVSPCITCTAVSTSIRGSCAVMVQRTTALTAPIRTITAGDSVRRGEIAKTTISATTPSDHMAAMVNPPKPAFCQVIEENA